MADHSLLEHCCCQVQVPCARSGAQRKALASAIVKRKPFLVNRSVRMVPTSSLCFLGACSREQVCTLSIISHFCAFVKGEGGCSKNRVDTPHPQPAQKTSIPKHLYQTHHVPQHKHPPHPHTSIHPRTQRVGARRRRAPTSAYAPIPPPTHDPLANTLTPPPSHANAADAPLPPASTVRNWVSCRRMAHPQSPRFAHTLYLQGNRSLEYN
ncbi:MAG: hypothetical protein KatS3mg017_0339 [Fimbriimonadales bacterium]|nr:MAG: hypothetical protein KatS3mg017_0339 [Fimbriimonadales bacterium]